ncbi:MAG: Ig-like domain-containing protein [Leptospiraceae bacterium]|nr:Ig-like domain-containing protein [Leptospiraceae bacterium]
MKPGRYFIGAVLAFALTRIAMGCKEDDLSELLIAGSTSPPRVLAAYPPDGTKNLNRAEGIWILFDRAMDKRQTERAFSLTGTKGEIPGGYTWQGNNRLEFHPSSRLEEAGNYYIRLTGRAESATGTDLDRQYRASFSLNEDNEGPSLIGSHPADGQQGVESGVIPILRFSEPVSFASLDRGIQVSPEFSYVLELDSNSASAAAVTIRPSSDLQSGVRYRITLNSDLEDRHGNPLENPHVISFFTGTDHEPPRIVNVQVSGEELAEGTVTEDIEKSGPLQIQFSEPMNTFQVEDSLSLPEESEDIAWNAAEDTLNVSFSLDPETYYEIQIAAGAEDLAGNTLENSELYPFLTDASRSQRPQVLSVEQDRVTRPGPVDGSERLEDYLPALIDYGIVDGSQTVDMDASPDLHEALVFRLLFDSNMEITSLYESLRFLPVLDTGNSDLTLHSLQHGRQQNEIIVYASWIPPGQQVSASPVFALQIESEARDTDGNSMRNRFRRFLSF